MSPPRTGRAIFALAACASTALAALAPAAKPAPAKPNFERQVRPLLVNRCGTCHGGDQRMGGLSIETRAGLLKGGASGEPAIQPGSAARSKLIRLVSSRKEGERMPPQGPPLGGAEVTLLRTWIDAGAAWPEPGKQKAEGSKQKAARTDAHWSFRPLRSVQPPVIRNPERARTTVDRFILAALDKKGITPAPEADPRTLVRRLYFDLVGLPPTPEEAEAFLIECAPAASPPHDRTTSLPKPQRSTLDARPLSTRAYGRPYGRTPGHLNTAYQRLVDRLLASPHFGERWARHWLDVARYADSNGQEGDQDRPTAYHYRDFVIRAFNEDLPYYTFVRWQLAGDEYEPDNPLAVSATGFVVAGPHTVLNVPMEEEKIRNRLNELDDMISTTGSAFLGLTVGCARCHDHKYDPVPHRDYYRLQAAFNGGDRAEVPLIPREQAARRRAAEVVWQRERDAARNALETWLAEQKKPLEKQLVSPDGKPKKASDDECRRLMTPEQRARWDELAAAVKTVETRRPEPLPTALAMADFGAKPRETWLLDRGDLRLKKERVELGFLSVLTNGKPASAYWAEARERGEREDTTYQRRALAEWLTDTDRGAGALLARVIVNRLWQHHFGEGLVRTVNDFGLQGEAPSHPELLEWLASELVRGGWKLKPIHRLIVNSAAYRRASSLPAPAAPDAGGDARAPRAQRPTPNATRIDPDNRLLWRRRPRRIEAEIFRDAMLAVSGSLNPRMYGPAFKPPIPPEAIQARNLKDPYPKDLKDTPETRRRSIYMFHKRVVQYPFLQAFDAPDAAQSCGRRNTTTVAPQALAVLNEPFIRSRAADFATRLLAEAGQDPAAQVAHAYRLALSRPPTRKELDASVEFLRQAQARRLARGAAAAPPEHLNTRTPEHHTRLLALTDLTQVIFGLNEFMYVD
jgi:hypothetical protein